MNIWMIGRGYPKIENHMQGSFELEQAKMLAKAGYRVIYLAVVFHPFRCVNRWGYDTWTEDGIEICLMCARDIPQRFRMYLTSYRAHVWTNFLERVSQQCGVPELVHIHYPAWITELSAISKLQQQRVKIVVTEHWSQTLLRQLRPSEKKRLTYYMKHADAVISVGKPLANSMKQISGVDREIFIVPNIVNPVFKCSEERKRLGKTFRFIAMGRMIPLRQYDQVIRAFDIAFHGRSDVELLLVGGGSEIRRLEKLITQLEAQMNVHLIGIQSRERCADLVASSDCLVCYSKYETFGVPVIEAWSCGVPVIVSDTLCFLETEMSELGLIVDASDLDSLCGAMQEMAQGKHQYEKALISAYAREKYSEAAVCRQLKAIYESVQLQKES